MDLCQVTGTVVATAKHPDYDGHKLLIVQPIDPQGAPAGKAYLAVDVVQAGVGDRVLVMREGNGVRQVLKASRLAIRSIVIGVVDEVEVVAA
jgi:ethanolamine utilization protein EutN